MRATSSACRIQSNIPISVLSAAKGRGCRGYGSIRSVRGARRAGTRRSIPHSFAPHDCAVEGPRHGFGENGFVDRGPETKFVSRRDSTLAAQPGICAAAKSLLRHTLSRVCGPSRPLGAPAGYRGDVAQQTHRRKSRSCFHVIGSQRPDAVESLFGRHVPVRQPASHEMVVTAGANASRARLDQDRARRAPINERESAGHPV